MKEQTILIPTSFWYCNAVDYFPCWYRIMLCIRQLNSHVGGDRAVLFKIFDKQECMSTSTSAWAWGHLGATVSRIGAITYHYESIYILKWFSPLKRAGSFMLTHRYLLLERWKETILKLIQNNCKAYLAILYKHCTSIRRCLYSKECSLSLLSWPYRLEILRLKRKRADWQKYHFWINM